MHGKQDITSWTRLAETAKARSNILILDVEVEWKEGDTIVITSTQYNTWQTETMVIRSVKGNTVTLTVPLQHQHIGINNSGLCTNI